MHVGGEDSAKREPERVCPSDRATAIPAILAFTTARDVPHPQRLSR